MEPGDALVPHLGALVKSESDGHEVKRGVRVSLHACEHRRRQRSSSKGCSRAGPACPQWCLQRLQKEEKEKEDEGLVTHGGFEIPMNVALHPALPSLLDGLPAHPEMDLAPLMNGNDNSR